MKKTVGLIVLGMIVFWTATDIGAAAGSVVLTVRDRAGVARSGEYLDVGVPVPRDWNIADASAFRLSDATGNPVPAQFEILARWGSHAGDSLAPAKWVLAGFFADVAAGSSAAYTLDASGPGPSASPAVSVDESAAGKMIVDTGSARFEINKTGQENLINQVTVGGVSVLTPLAASAAIEYQGIGGIDIVAGGTPNAAPRTRAVTLERSGDLSCVVKVTGSILTGTAVPVLDYTARLTFYAGSPDVRVDYTVENNHPVLESDSQPSNVHDQGSVNSVYVGSLKLTLQLAGVSSDLRVLTESSVDVSNPSSAVRLYQDSSGTDNWDVYVGNVGWDESSLAPATPRLQAYCAQRGYTVTGPDISETGNQALGWMSASLSSGPGVIVACRDFWQNFPKALEAGSGGKISVDLFPNGTQFNHNLRVGEEKTHTVFYRFTTSAPSSTEAENLARAVNSPLAAAAPASWYAASGALGEIPAADAVQWPLYENYVNVAHTPNPSVTGPDDSGFGNGTLSEAIDKYNFYGWQDYGDVPLDYEAFGPSQAGQMNLKYWYVYGMLLQFCRSADPDWLDLALPAARHLSDIDYLHIPDTGIAHWSHGSYFGHSAHDEPGNTNPNRNSNSPSVDLFFGVPDLFLAYCLTGEHRFRDVALEGLQAMLNLSQFSDLTYPVFYRERANLIFAYLEGYRQTGDSRWLTAMKTVISETMKTSDKTWISDPLNYVPPPYGPVGESERVSGFQIGQTLWAVGKYLDFCREYGLTDDTGAVAALETYGDFIITHLMKEISAYLAANHSEEFSAEELTPYAGHYATIDSIWFTADYETYLEVNNWALLFADVLAYVYRYSGKQTYLDAAAHLYLTGTVDQVWLGDPPVYIASKDLVNSLNWGLVYMDESAAAASRPCSVDFTGADITGTLQTGMPVRFAVTTSDDCAGDPVYRFSSHPEYGTAGYDGKHWQTMTSTEWISDSTTDYTFTQGGKHIVVVWAADSSDAVPAGIPIAGWSVDLGSDTDKTDITGFSMTGTLAANSPVTLAVTARNASADTLYYRFSVRTGYGTASYDINPWQSMTSTEWVATGTIDYTFTRSGKYIVVVWVSDTASDVDSTGIPMIGWAVDIE